MIDLVNKNKTIWIFVVVVIVYLFGTSIVFIFSEGIYRSVVLGLLGIVTLVIILKYPYSGIGFMLASLPFGLFTSLPGNLRDFTSLTSFFGAITLGAYLLQNKVRYENGKLRDYVILISFFLFFVLLMIGEFIKPVSTGFTYPFTYFQIAILLVLSIRLFNNPQKIERVMFLFVAANLLAIIVSLQDFEFYSNWGYINRLSGSQGNANEFALYLSVSVVILIYWAVRTKKRSYRFLAVILIIISLIPIILSGSRGAILFLIPVFFLQVYRISNHKLISLVLLLIVGLALFGILQTYFPIDYLNRVYGIPKNIIELSDTIGFRYEIWKYGLGLWSQKPVFGFGSGMFQHYSIYSPVLHGIKRVPAHSIYVTLLVENGILGLSLFLLIVGKTITNFERAILRNKSVKQLAITWESILMIILLNGTKLDLATNKLLWFCIAISIVVSQIPKEKFEN